jgi:cell division protein FtsL
MTTSPLSRARVPRIVETAAVRSRLALVPPRSTRARRTPFVVLVCAVLLAGVVGLLMFNTQMQQTSFHVTALQARATALQAQQQDLAMELQRLRDPQRLAERARALGMVVPQDPAFVRLGDGRILGTPTVTGPDDAMRVRSFSAEKPADLAPKPRIVRVPAVVTPAETQASTGAASPSGTAAQGRKVATAPTGAQRAPKAGQHQPATRP